MPTPRNEPGWMPTACPMDCPDACALEAKVDEGRVVALRGTHGHEVTAGFMCAKMTRYPDRVNGGDRVLTPLIRRGPKDSEDFEPASWDAALDLVARRLEDVKSKFGGEAILPYHYDGSNGIFAHDFVDEALWRRLGASRTARTLCAAPATEAAMALYGRMPGVAFQDYVHARLVIVWGANPSASNIHLVPYINEARRRGAKLVVVDPRRNQVAAHADLHLAVWPGSDLVVALWLIGEIERRNAVARTFLAEHARHADLLLAEARGVTIDAAARAARVEPRDLERLADLYVAEAPAVIRIGWGLERNRNGDGAMAAILALPAIAGKFGVRGGGYTLSNSGAFQTRADELVDTPFDGAAPRTLNMVELGRILEPSFTPPVKALIVYDANPLVSTPDQERIRRGLARRDLFVAAIEQVVTETCRYADVILPATTFLEQDELHRGYGAMVVQRIRPVVPPRGEAKPNQVIFAELARRLGYEGADLDPSPARMTRKFEAASKGLPAGAAERLERGEIVAPAFEADGPVQFLTAFPLTPDRKIDLHPEKWRKAGHRAFAFAREPATREFPLAMISPASHKTINSILGEASDETIPCHLSAHDAAARGIAEGERVRVRSSLGSIEARARVDASLRPGVCMIPKGVWLRNCPSGGNANALIKGTVTPISGGATYNDARVQVERI